MIKSIRMPINMCDFLKTKRKVVRNFAPYAPALLNELLEKTAQVTQ
jgi:hypothetical protein